MATLLPEYNADAVNIRRLAEVYLQPVRKVIVGQPSSFEIAVYPIRRFMVSEMPVVEHPARTNVSRGDRLTFREIVGSMR